MGARDASRTFGQQLRQHREAAGLTQDELAERAGLTAKAVSALERGERRRPYPQTVRALAEALGLGDEDRAALIAAVPSRTTPPEPPRTPDDPRPVGAVGLPPEPGPLVGRDEELAVLRDQLLDADVRLLTVLGPGGVGKTRLATAVADQLAGEPAFPGGVWFVDLAPTHDPSQVPGTIARAVRAAASAASGSFEALQAFVARGPLLLVVDNFEHVLAAAGDVSRLVATAPGLTVLVTSRQPLRLRWERTLPLAPLALPDPRHLPTLDRLAAVPAVALFLERAQATAPGFRLTPENASAVAELCVRLDGLPLAIELVAARAGQLGPHATLERLARGLPVPASGMRDAPARHQSVRATLQWSLDLLGDAERTLFRRLACCSGGWTLSAAEALAGDDVGDALEVLTSLADKSLVTPDARGGSEPRFRMLETIREVALELLGSSGEEEAVRERHAEYFASLAEEAAPKLQGASQAATVSRLELEEDNFRGALRWARTSGTPAALEAGLRLAGALGWYWFLHGYPLEARDWFDVLLRPASSGEGPVEPGSEAARLETLRARALNAAGFRATDQAEYEVAASFHEEALATWRRLGDASGLVASLHGVGDTALWMGNAAKARASYEDGLSLARTDGTAEDAALFGFHLAQLSWLLGELDAADAYGDEALAGARSAGSTTWPPYALFVLASVAHERGDVDRAGELYREAIRLGWDHHDRLCIRMVLPGLAALATLEGDPARALRLAGAASALEENAGIWAFPPIRERHERWLAAAREALDDRTAETAWSEGRSLTIEEAIDDALQPAVRRPSPVDPDVAGRGRLSRREREVLELVAEGKSNRQIADVLFVTEHTAKYHVASLFNKLGADSRAEAVTRAVALGLLTPARD